MNKAQKINLLLQEDLKRLDPWIDGYLTDRFISSAGKTVRIDIETSSLQAVGLSSDAIIKALQSNGFHVETVYPDRPCVSGYYSISIPPQGE